jgi:hypothetical protein
MSRDLEIILRRSIVLEHPRWTWEQITAALRDAEAGQGPYAILTADLLASNGSESHEGRCHECGPERG